MSCNQTYLIEDFFAVGISYKNTDAATRGQFAISFKQYEAILELAPSYGVEEMFVLSTCNRTEIYGFAKNPSYLLELLHNQSSGDFELLSKMVYVKNGIDSISHLYHVACGLDSQILGDYEIVSQLKQAVNFSRDHKFMGSFLERLVSSVFQSSKKIKTYTALSSGSVSVSFSAAKYIKENTNFSSQNKILVLGAGKIGRNTCKNLLGYFDAENITVINRSIEKAINLADELNINYASGELLPSQIDLSDIIIVATNSIEPVILKSHLANKSNKIIIDLSLPCNVEEGVNDLPNIKVIHVDQISKLKDESLIKRAAEIPKAKKIIAGQIKEFMQWHKMRRQVPILKSIKAKLEEINQFPFFTSDIKENDFQFISMESRIQDVINSMATKMLGSKCKGCHYIEAINKFIMVDAS
ncbi:MAG TPA: glutamyl-tRNA reductase [Hanamia sp.]|nr:glutamyl-tRNA reductase [Hanamia sp.]